MGVPTRTRPVFNRGGVAVLVIALLTAGLWLARASAPAGAQLVKFNWADKNGGIEFALEFTSGVRPKLYDVVRDKHFFYVDYYGATGPTQNQQWNLDHPVIRQVKRFYYADQKVLRLIFYPRAEGRIDVAHSGFGQSFVVKASLPASARVTPVKGGGPSSRKLVVIDPGHGGWHYGAEGKVDGRTYYEKEITLKIAERLTQLFEKAPNLTYVVTRRDDTYVSLDDRIEIADKAKGDLFVSIHLNATDAKAKTARGFEVYSLADGNVATNRQLELLENEGKLHRGPGSGEGANVQTILTSLVDEKIAQRRRESMLASQVFHKAFGAQGPFTSMCRGAKTANFRVLLNYNMPSVLLECGFLDNPQDAAMLVKPQTQEEIAILIFNAINDYFGRVDANFRPFQAPPPKREPSIVAAPRRSRAR